MTISFPRAKPDALKVVSLKFILERNDELNPTRGGAQISVDLGPALWTGEWSSPPLEEEDFGEVRAWFDTLAGDQQFYGYDSLREYPVRYRSGFGGLTVDGNPFTGTAYLIEVAGNKVEVVLSGLPIGFVLRPGDYFSFDYGGVNQYRALHRISSAGVADSAGLMAVEVRPYIRPGWEDSGSPAARAVTFYRPSARMLVVPGSYDEQIPVNRYGSISFKAVQSL